MLSRLAQPLFIGLLAVAAPGVAQEKSATKATGSDMRGGSQAKEPSMKATPATINAATGAMMDAKPAPKAGSMRGNQTLPPNGRLGTETTRTDKLGTPPPNDSKDRPPRPQ